MMKKLRILGLSRKWLPVRNVEKYRKFLMLVESILFSILPSQDIPAFVAIF